MNSPMMSAQSTSPTIPTNTLSPGKSQSISFAMLFGYGLAALFLIGVVVLIVLYVKKPCSGSGSGSDPEPSPFSNSCTVDQGNEMAHCGPNGKCTCDCKSACKNTNLTWNGTTCNIDSNNVCPQGSTTHPTYLEWNSNTQTCAISPDYKTHLCNNFLQTCAK